MSGKPLRIDELAANYVTKMTKGVCRSDAQNVLDCRADGGPNAKCRRYDTIFAHCIVEDVCPDQLSALSKGSCLCCVSFRSDVRLASS